MNLYTFKIDKECKTTFSKGFCFRRQKNGPICLYDELLKRVQLHQPVEMLTSRQYVKNGFLLSETRIPKVLVDKFEGTSERALLHIKARRGGVEISPGRSETLPLLKASWPDLGYSSWIYEMRSGDLMDIDIPDGRVFRMTFDEGIIHPQKLYLD